MQNLKSQNLYENELQCALLAAKEARKILMHYLGNLANVEEKFQAGLVSEADKTSEAKIKAILKSVNPDYGFLGEEEAYGNLEALKVLDSEGMLWVVDPLDGTTNFVHRFPIFCSSIALVKNGSPVVGVIDVPVTNETFWAVRGRGAFRNEKTIHVTQTKSLSTCLSATGFFGSNRQEIVDQMKILTEMILKTRGVRRAGSAAYDLSMVASGVFDFYWEKNLSPWDTAAGILLVEEAGGQVSTIQNGPYKITSNSILASNKHIHDAVVKEINF
jgi:myo-inositol-1(or 4)-monophosphatase